MSAGHDGGQVVGFGVEVATDAEGDVANIGGKSDPLGRDIIALHRGESEAAFRSNERGCAASVGEAQGSLRSDISLWRNRTGRGIAQAVRNGSGEESLGVGERGVAERKSAGEEPLGVRCAGA